MSSLQKFNINAKKVTLAATELEVIVLVQYVAINNILLEHFNIKLYIEY